MRLALAKFAPVRSASVKSLLEKSAPVQSACEKFARESGCTEQRRDIRVNLRIQ